MPDAWQRPSNSKREFLKRHATGLYAVVEHSRKFSSLLSSMRSVASNQIKRRIEDLLILSRATIVKED